MDVTDTLTEKAGPFPVWVWGLLLGGVAVAFMWLNRGDSSAEDGYSFDGLDPYSAMGLNDAALFTGNNGGDQYDAPGSGEDAEAVAIRNNAQWLRAGVAYLISRGHNAFAAQRALDKYLAGKRLTQAQSALVESVIAHLGLPPKVPNLPPAGGNNGPDDPGNGGTPDTLPTTHKVKGQSDNNPDKLAAMYYGKSGEHAESLIRAANPGKRAPYKVGSRIRIPKWKDKPVSGGGHGSGPSSPEPSRQPFAATNPGRPIQNVVQTGIPVEPRPGSSSPIRPLPPRVIKVVE